MPKNEFYIGYFANAPKGIVRLIKGVIVALFAIAIVVAFGISSGQKFISNGSYEYGELTELEGQLYDSPVPFLKVSAGKDLLGNEIFKNILLINYGKFGADQSVQIIKSRINIPLNEVKVRIRGTLIYHNGVTLLELTEKENSFQSASKTDSKSQYAHEIGRQGMTTLAGEIIDPKCYFGSMKPGQGKPHKSCAGLCIEGGIPPMFVVQNENKQADYYLIIGEHGEKINQEITKHIASPVRISGRIESFDEWNIIYIDPSQIQQLE